MIGWKVPSVDTIRKKYPEINPRAAGVTDQNQGKVYKLNLPGLDSLSDVELECDYSDTSTDSSNTLSSDSDDETLSLSTAATGSPEKSPNKKKASVSFDEKNLDENKRIIEKMKCPGPKKSVKRRLSLPSKLELNNQLIKKLGISDTEKNNMHKTLFFLTQLKNNTNQSSKEINDILTTFLSPITKEEYSSRMAQQDEDEEIENSVGQGIDNDNNRENSKEADIAEELDEEENDEAIGI